MLATHQRSVLLQSLVSLYHRYESQNLRLKTRGFPLNSPRHIFGYIDQITLAGRELTIEGWCNQCQLDIGSSLGCKSVSVTLPREDVAEKYGSKAAGFRATVPFGNGRIFLRNESHEDVWEQEFSPFSTAALWLAKSKLKLRFVFSLVVAFPTWIVWRTRKDDRARARLKKRLQLSTPPKPPLIDSSALPLNPDQPKTQMTCPIAIVLPVYNAFELLPEALSRVIANTDLRWHLILIEDASSDPKVRPWLRDWVDQHQDQSKGNIELIENDQNLGFVTSVNRGLTRASQLGWHTVLLNSDALVPKGWASRLMRPILEDPNVASTTPMSNNAEIFSVPKICTSSKLKPHQADIIDQFAAKLPWASAGDAPTGVGFCMGMNAEFISKIPKLDTVFGRGYGEEVDWCQRARACGGRHVGVPNLFVEHRGGASFGSNEKAHSIAANSQIITTRYPRFDLDVQTFIATDPALSARLYLAVTWAATQASTKPLPIYLAHSMGGGADLYLEDKIQRDLKDHDLPSLVIRVGTEHRWQIEVVTPTGRIVGATNDFETVQTILSPAQSRKIIYSCGVGDSAPLELPKRILSLCTSSADHVEILVHDFFMLSPNYTLLDKNGIYNGPRKAKQPANSTYLQDGFDQDDAWYTAWTPLFKRAQIVRVFSESSRNILSAARPDIAARLNLCPHKLLSRITPIQASATGDKRIIAALGNIGFPKGAKVLRELASLMDTVSGIDLMVLGNVDPQYPLGKETPIHGAYDLEDMGDLVAHYGITDWIIPSIWPETFSYTTHEALATGMPTYAFDLGAQGDAVNKAPYGIAIPYTQPDQLAKNALNTLLENQPVSRSIYPQRRRA